MQKQIGLTLIEVLIALAIVGIAMTAIIKSTSQMIRGTNYLQDKTIAMWVGQEVMNEVRVGIRNLSTSDPLEEITTQLGKDWRWKLSQEDTPNQRIKKIKVKVFANKTQDNDHPLMTLESYIYHAE